MYLKEKDFELIFKDNLGELYNQALRVFKNYGHWLENRLFAIYLLAINQGKIEIVIIKLEWFWNNELQFIHPEHRFGHWQVENLFRCLEKNILK